MGGKGELFTWRAAKPAVRSCGCDRLYPAEPARPELVLVGAKAWVAANLQKTLASLQVFFRHLEGLGKGAGDGEGLVVAFLVFDYQHRVAEFGGLAGRRRRGSVLAYVASGVSSSASRSWSTVVSPRSLVRSIDEVLRSAGWKRIASRCTFPSVNIYGKEDFCVPETITNGVRIQVEPPEAPFADDIPVVRLPLLVRTAISLNIALSLSIFPPEKTGDPVPVNAIKGTSQLVQISVGKKP